MSQLPHKTKKFNFAVTVLQIVLALVIVMNGGSGSTALGQSTGEFDSTSPHDSTPTELLQSQIRAELSQFLFPEQYVMSVIERSSNGGVDVLPGLPSSSGVTGIDILLVLDTGVSDAKAELARAIIERIGGDQVALQLASAPVLKTTPPAILDEIRLKNTVYPQNQQSQDPPLLNELEGPRDGEPQPAEQAPPRIESPPTLFELIQASPRFSVYVLAVLWAAVASMLGLAYLLKRLFNTPDQTPSRTAVKPQIAPKLEGPHEGLARKHRDTANFGPASLEEKVRKQDQSISQEESHERVPPHLIARVLSKWVSESSHGLLRAQQYFKSLSLKEIESVGSMMHKDDIRILSQSITSDLIKDLDASEQYLLERHMRAELSLVNTQEGSAQSHSPLDFLSTLDSSTLSTIISSESDYHIAVICTQLPAQRLQFLLSFMDEVRLASILSMIHELQNLKLEDVIPLAERLRSNLAAVESSLLRPDMQIDSAARMLDGIADLSKRSRIAGYYFASSSSDSDAVHRRVLLLSDVAFLSPQCLRALAQTMESQTLAYCFSTDPDLGDITAARLPAAYGQMFRETLKSEPSRSSQLEAWSELSKAIRNLSDSGVIDERDIQRAKAESRKYLAETYPKQDSRPADVVPLAHAGGAA